MKLWMLLLMVIVISVSFTYIRYHYCKESGGSHAECMYYGCGGY